MSSHRLERVNELVKRELGEILRRDAPIDRCGLLTVNAVDVSGDLRQATAFIGVLGNAQRKKAAEEWLESNRISIQNEIGGAIVLRHTPKLRFITDDSVERGNRVLDIMAEIEGTSDSEPAPKPKSKSQPS